MPRLVEDPTNQQAGSSVRRSYVDYLKLEVWGEKPVDVEELRRAVRSGLGEGDFTLLYLWTRFWSNGGCASTAYMECFVNGLQALSDSDALVLGSIVDEIHNTPEDGPHDAVRIHSASPSATVRHST